MQDVWFQHLASALSGSGMAAYTWDASEDRFEWAGDLCGLLGLEQQSYPRCNAQFHMMINPQNVAERMTALHDVMGQKPNGVMPSLSSTYKIKRADGTYVDVIETATLNIDSAGGGKLLCGIIKPSMANTAQEAETARSTISYLDTGTAHSGRQVVQRKISEWFAQQDPLYTDAYLLVAGINGLSLFNQAYGPRYADEILEKTATRLKKLAGDYADVVRIDGDMFSLLFHRAPHNEMASIAGFILKNFQDAPIETSQGPAAVGLSIGGITVSKSRPADAATLLTQAEDAMIGAKKQGRNSFLAYKDTSLQADGTRKLLASGNAFLEALRDGRVRLAFQPIVDAQHENVSFHESLIRFVDESGKVHAAGNFLPALERLGMGQLVDQFVLRTAIQELTMFPDLSLSVNLSSLSLTYQDWLRGLVAALRDRPSVAKRLIIEITENTVMNDMGKTMRVVRTLQDLGCRVALDDFGAGYTAFSQLRELNIDIVKIDKSFVRNLSEGDNHLFVKTLQTLADGIQVETVGEGAETAAEARILADDGINHIQGYVYGFPQTERVWLPKDHIYRRMSPELSGRTEARESVERDIAVFKFGSS